MLRAVFVDPVGHLRAPPPVTGGGANESPQVVRQRRL